MMRNFWEKTLDVMKKRGADAIVVSEGNNMRYLSGFRGETGYLYISPQRRVLLTDSRYTVMAKAEAPDFEVMEISSWQSYGQLLKDQMDQDHASKVGYEDEYMLCKTYKMLQEACDHRLNVELGYDLDCLRSVKEEWELECLAKAEEIGDMAFTHILNVIKPGFTEREVAAELEYFMKKNGAENLSFETIVASGPNSAMPHAMPSERKIQAGDFVTMDFGCKYMGYCSDMTRTIIVGKADKKQKEIYGTVLKAQTEALAALRSGVRGCDVDKIAREIITEAGYGDCFGHGLGHSVGLFIHEEPRLSPKCEDTLLVNMIQTVEPGIYIPDFGGVRIEDMVIVKENGYVNLAHSPKELIEL